MSRSLLKTPHIKAEKKTVSPKETQRDDAVNEANLKKNGDLFLEYAIDQTAASSNTQKKNDTKSKNPKHYEGHRTRLKQKFIKSGVKALYDYEFLELLLCLAIPRRDVKPIAKALLSEFHDISSVLNAPEKKLLSISGIGGNCHYIFRLFSEAAHYILKENVNARPVLSNWSKLCDYARLKIGHLEHEEFHIWLLDTHYHILHEACLARGTIDRAVIYPREVVKLALDHSASSVILLHNHPSGDTDPSGPDVNLTTKLIDAFSHIDIHIIDHIIVGRNDITSMRNLGLMG
ncbi:MAG: DNA repair protein RadC [Pseudomonadota bacterium]